MHIATYNLRKGGRRGNRVHWARIFAQVQPAVFLVQESLTPAQYLPPELLAECRPRCSNGSQWQLHWVPIAGNGWGSALFVSSAALRPIEIPGYAGWVVGAYVEEFRHPHGETGPLKVFSLHAPAGQGGYVGQINRILDHLATHHADCPILLGGDFNMTVSRPPEKGQLKRFRTAMRLLDRLEVEFGLINCWQTANPEKPLAQTLRWSRDPSVPYHCDGLFVPRSWQNQLRSCEVLFSSEWESLSDHNPVIAGFEHSERLQVGDGN